MRTNKLVSLSSTLGAGGSLYNGTKSIIGEGQVLKNLLNFPSAVRGWIRQNPKGNALKPLAKDTVYMTPGNHGGVNIDIPFTEHGSFGRTLSEGYTVQDIETAIKELRLARSQEMALCKYSQYPTQENFDKALKLFPSELQENAKGLLRSAKEHERWHMA